MAVAAASTASAFAAAFAASDAGALGRFASRPTPRGASPPPSLGRRLDRLGLLPSAALRRSANLRPTTHHTHNKGKICELKGELDRVL